MDPDADPDRRQGRPLHLQDASNGVAGANKGDHKRVALTLLHRPNSTICSVKISQKAIERGHRGGHLITPPLPQPGGTLDITQHQRDDPVCSTSLMLTSLQLS